jgi:hypothetical protein
MRLSGRLYVCCVVMLVGMRASLIGAQSSPNVDAKAWLDAGQRSAIDKVFATQADSPGYAVAVIKDGEFALA